MGIQTFTEWEKPDGVQHRQLRQDWSLPPRCQVHIEKGTREGAFQVAGPGFEPSITAQSCTRELAEKE